MAPREQRLGEAEDPLGVILSEVRALRAEVRALRADLDSRAGNELVDVVQAARELGVSPSTLNQWRCSGRGPDFVSVGRRRLYRRSTLHAWLKGQGRAS
jgi:hypothetical protein